jgi:hypothetical protein
MRSRNTQNSAPQKNMKNRRNVCQCLYPKACDAQNASNISDVPITSMRMNERIVLCFANLAPHHTSASVR